MALTGINSEDRLVQQTFATHLHDTLGWETVYTQNTETFGPKGKPHMALMGVRRQIFG